MKRIYRCQAALLILMGFAFANSASAGKVGGNGVCNTKEDDKGGRFCGTRVPKGAKRGDDCECGLFFSDSLYFSAYRVEDFNAVAAEVLSSFSPQPVRGPNGTFTTPTFTATQVENGTQAGIGAVLRLSDWLALDLGIAFGSGAASRSSIDRPAASEKAHFRLFAGHIAARVYPLQTERVRPWLSAGARGLALHPTGGTYTSEDQRLDIPGRLFQPASAADLISGAGIDIRLTDRLGASFSGEHGFRTGWRAGAAVIFSLPSREP